MSTGFLQSDFVADAEEFVEGGDFDGDHFFLFDAGGFVSKNDMNRQLQIVNWNLKFNFLK